ncbi:ABC transporter substrate-binding protein [Mesorhizobium sp. BR1-1-16]|uniref:ABC transporter substrate-binding protein n=1 Tax=Mesorhizobium sp. BR1-1-16 TaxID=2876653 RepID=UPI001CC9A051|nr:ABC transporter substrate-binding protein [Mesorhizobium sp. BR1-1-16]MBZ9935619.1 ABC transporter substrate-binding protein [Mesorhizobium sp. BR1-1-16]
MQISTGVKRILSIVAVATAATFCVGQAMADDMKCHPEQLATKYPSLVGKTIKIATDGATPPYSMRDPNNFDNLIGLDNDMARAAFACIGLPVDFMVGSWSGLLPAVIAGQADVMWDTLYYTPERAKEADFVVYLRAATGGLVQKNNPKKIKSLDDVCGVRATAGLGSTEEAVFRDLSAKCVAAGKPEIEIVTFPDIPAGSRLVKNDRADLLMIDLGLVNSFIAADPDAFDLAFSILTDYKVGVGVAKNNKELTQAVFDALKILQADGTEEAIYKKYNFDHKQALPTEILTK